jgi:hypothetical protein
VFPGARGQDDDRHLLPGRIAAQAREQLEAVEVGQHDVEQHEIGGIARVDAFDGLAAVGDRLDDEALLLGQVAEQIGHVNVVLDDQQPLACARIRGHGPLPVRRILEPAASRGCDRPRGWGRI